jgi:hypothetical protein
MFADHPMMAGLDLVAKGGLGVEDAKFAEDAIVSDYRAGDIVQLVCEQELLFVLCGVADYDRFRNVRVLADFGFAVYSGHDWDLLNKHLKDCGGELVVDVLDEVFELLGPYIVAMAFWRAEAVYGVLELEGFFELKALDD